MKKLLVILLIAVLALALTVPALASDDLPAVSARLVGNGNNARVEITIAGNPPVGNLSWANNRTETYLVHGYYVAVQIQGNSVRSAVVTGQSIVNAPNPNNGGSQGGNVENKFFDNNNKDLLYVNKDYNNANFHCNTLGGNGRVWLTMGKDMSQKWSAPLNFKKVADEPISIQANRETAWLLQHNNVFICEVCGSNEWVTFSNNSGVPDGKNIQMNHPGQYLIIDKAWEMLAGDRAPSNVRFDIKLINGKTITVGPGRHFLPNGTYEITERDIPNFTLVGIEKDGQKVDLGTVEVILRGNDVRVKFTNEENPYGMIIKTWADGNPGKLTARFHIENADGRRVVTNAVAGTKYYLPVGEYTVIEVPTTGYHAHRSQTLIIEADKFATVEFENMPVYTRGNFSIAKIAEGESIALWLLENFPSEWESILSDMRFDLWTSNSSGDLLGDAPVNENMQVDSQGYVAFTGLSSGWYVVVEKLGPIAGRIFEAPENLLLEISVNSLTGDVVILQSSGGSKAIIFEDHNTFDFGALYQVVYSTGGMRSLGISGLNGGGEIFPIALRNTATGDIFDSFCANGGSLRFAGDNHLSCNGYLVAANTRLDVYNAFISAFNYIEDTYGNLNDNRILTQAITWILLNDSTVAGTGGASLAAVLAGNLTETEKAQISDIIANYMGYKGEGTIVDLVYLLCEAGHDFTYCQPQLLALYDGKVAFENVPGSGGTDGSVVFTKVKYGGLLTVASGEFGFELFKDVNGEWELQGVYYNNESGNVIAEDLSPGSYKFVEVLTVDHDLIPGQEGTFGYRYVWKAIYPGNIEGLYFTITKEGKTEWRDGSTGIPTVNNIHYCKHAMQWTFATDEANYLWSLSIGREAFPVAGHTYGQWGLLLKGACLYVNCTEITIEEATCISDKVIDIRNNCEVSATGFRIGIPGTMIPHDMQEFENFPSACGFNGYKTEICVLGCGLKETEYFEFDDHVWVLNSAPGFNDPWWLHCEVCFARSPNACSKNACVALTIDDCICTDFAEAEPVSIELPPVEEIEDRAKPEEEVVVEPEEDEAETEAETEEESESEEE